MKHLSKFMAAMMFLSSMSIISCSEENVSGPTAPDDPEAKNVVYSKIRFRLPESSRSTEKEGEEIGKNEENSIGSILVVLATKAENGDYTYLTHALSDVPVPDRLQPQQTIVFQNKTTLIEHAGDEVFVFAYCNPTEALRSKITEMSAEGAADLTFTDLICAEDIESIWSDNGFLMSSASITKITLGANTESMEPADYLKTCNTPARAFNLGKVDVIRAASRLDYRDGSPADTDPYTYNIMDPDDNTKQVAKVRLNRMALINRRNQFYYLPRVNTSTQQVLCPGLDENGMEIDNPGYVVTPAEATYDEVNPGTITADNINTLKWTKMTDLTADDIDDSDWTGSVNPSDNYKFWRYTTENTANGVLDDNGQALLSIDATTGILFEAEITDVEGMTEGESMYMYGSTLYANGNLLDAAVKAAPISNLATAYKEAGFHEADGKFVPTNDEAAIKAGFTVYKPTTAPADGKQHYFCYYWYYIKHNDDQKPTTTGTMEYATVRNNIYKLSVTGISNFGTYKPDEKVEDWDAYFQMSVQVKKWVVRVNNIEL